jgi:hypothetical protein
MREANSRHGSPNSPGQQDLQGALDFSGFENKKPRTKAGFRVAFVANNTCTLSSHSRQSKSWTFFVLGDKLQFVSKSRIPLRRFAIAHFLRERSEKPAV